MAAPAGPRLPARTSKVKSATCMPAMSAKSAGRPSGDRELAAAGGGAIGATRQIGIGAAVERERRQAGPRRQRRVEIERGARGRLAAVVAAREQHGTVGEAR